MGTVQKCAETCIWTLGSLQKAGVRWIRGRDESCTTTPTLRFYDVVSNVFFKN